MNSFFMTGMMNKMVLNPKLFEINTRVWIKQFDKGIKLSGIPVEIWKKFAAEGIDIIWLMGIWDTCPGLIDKCCFSADLISSYSRSLDDWKKEDVIGSPFSINDYIVNPDLGNWDEMIKLKKTLNSLGLKLFLDFIPNHFGAETNWLKDKSEIFLQADKDLYQKDTFTFFENNSKYFAHGRDPLFPAWTDTVQINYFNTEAREFMTDILLKLTEVCDGVRCDMSMLPLNNVFENTWLGVLNRTKYTKPKDEFWETAIKKVKEKSPSFIFMAEAYWDLEWDLQQLGFDFTYDKRFTDRLSSGDIQGVKAHLNADPEFQLKSVRFLENHDEARAVTKFGKKQSFAASVLMSTIRGMKLFFDGQFEGKKIRLPLQLGREPVEKISGSIKEHYEKILRITKEDIFVHGEWSMLYPLPVSDSDSTFESVFAWQWKLNDERRIVIVNYSNNAAYCRLKLNLSSQNGDLFLDDLLNGDSYKRCKKEIASSGLFVELKCFHSHIFSFKD